jgi:hypothetical protein
MLPVPLFLTELSAPSFPRCVDAVDDADAVRDATRQKHGGGVAFSAWGLTTYNGDVREVMAEFIDPARGRSRAARAARRGSPQPDGLALRRRAD